MEQSRSRQKVEKPTTWWRRLETSQATTSRMGSDWVWLAAVILSIIWWTVAAQHSKTRLVLLMTLSLASLAVGCIVGFLFTSYGEEAGTVGKVRDWVVGGLTGITIVKAGAIKGLLLTFAAGPGPSEFGLVAGTAVTYSVLGFFFMFFERELFFNPLLAESRAQRERLEGTRQAAQVVQQALAALPISILSGVDDIDDIVDSRKAEAEKLGKSLDSPEVNKFLDEAEQAVQSGNADWDIVSKAANLYYYRTYFEKDEEIKRQKAEIADEWIQRALVMNPLHVDLTVKHAAMLDMMNRSEEAVAILENLDRTPEAPAFVKQWLGTFLLDVPDRLDDAIRYSEAYHKMFPAESDALYNIANAYARKYCREADAGEKHANPEDRLRALANLKEALARQPAFLETVREKWTQPDASFHCLAHDPEFRKLVGPPAESARKS
jgi:tetratricopeptide (TPR) repeat protein